MFSLVEEEKKEEISHEGQVFTVIIIFITLLLNR